MLSMILKSMCRANDVLAIGLTITRSYPFANGHDDQNAESQPIEETGNLLTLVWIYTKNSGNAT